MQKLQTLLRNRNFMNNQNYVVWKLNSSKALWKYYLYLFDTYLVNFSYFLLYVVGLLSVTWIPFVGFYFHITESTNDLQVIFFFIIAVVLMYFLVAYFLYKKDFLREKFVVMWNWLLFIMWIIFGTWFLAKTLGWFGIFWVILVDSIIVLILIIFWVIDTLFLILRVFIAYPIFLLFRLLAFIFPKNKVFFVKNFHGKDIKLRIFDNDIYWKISAEAKLNILVLYIWSSVFLGILYVFYYLFSTKLNSSDEEGVIFFMALIMFFSILSLMNLPILKSYNKKIRNKLLSLLKVNLIQKVRLYNVKDAEIWYIFDKFVVIKK